MSAKSHTAALEETHKALSSFRDHIEQNPHLVTAARDLAQGKQAGVQHVAQRGLHSPSSP